MRAVFAIVKIVPFQRLKAPLRRGLKLPISPVRATVYPFNALKPRYEGV